MLERAELAFAVACGLWVCREFRAVR